MKKPGGQSKEWQSILMVPYGRGGAGFSVLDVTDPNSPKHLYSILNDRIRGMYIDQIIMEKYLSIQLWWSII